MTMDMLDLAPMEAWKRLEKEIDKNFSINPGVFNAGHKRLTDGADWCNGLCPALRSSPGGMEAVCAIAGQHFAASLRRDREPLVRECDAGLLKVAVPVVSRGELAGAVGGCGCILPEGVVDCFLLHKIMGVPEEDVRRLAASVPVLRRDEIDRLVAFLEEKVAEMVGPDG